jgi:hypothetical protein
MNQELNKTHFESCIGCGANISIDHNGDNYCPNCVALEAKSDALVELVVNFAKALERQGYDRLEVRHALEFAPARYEEGLEQAA